MADVPRWRLTGDWFDLCRCRVPCGCTFAQPPDEGRCDGILAWHVREGRYGETALDGLNVVGVGGFDGNIWTRRRVPGVRGEAAGDHPELLQAHQPVRPAVHAGRVRRGGLSVRAEPHPALL